MSASPGAPAATAAPHACAHATTRCDGAIEVPLNWDDASSERISVAFAWLPAKAADGTVVANIGGPARSLPTVELVQRLLGPVLDHKNLLLVDPRGFGKSTPLLCPGIDLMKSATIAACAERVGARAQYFTADQASHDLEAIRRALGLGKVSYFGNSYGTLFAQAYAARYPGSLDALFLDSVLVYDRDGYATWPIRFQAGILDLICGRSPACAALPGSASGTWARLVERLRKQPDPEVPALKSGTLGQVPEPVFRREAAGAATAYLQGDPAPLRRLARRVPDGVDSADDPSSAAYLAYRCGDGSFPFDRSAAPTEREAQALRYYERVRPLAPYRLTEVIADVKTLEVCVNWPTPRHSPPRPVGAALPAVPVLVVTGDLDTNPPADVRRSMRVFPGAVVLRVPFGGHALSFSPGSLGACVLGTMRTFLTTKQVTDRGCTAENYRATGAFPQVSADLPPYPARGLTAGQRRVLAAAFATAEDAAARRNPQSGYYVEVRSEPGLRGGQVSLGETVVLDGVRFVRDVRTDGRIRFTPDGRATPGGAANGNATAELRVTAGGRTHEVRLTWAPFSTRPAVSGTFDGIPFGS
ncbi:alpha/beta fold hydrolase [Nonomuraea typhae]|uniref:Alpha/beta fold hydrolase n=1 Tax=Nonomuraea typhae TaxID=2603600 RepID=A0ABW7ZB83_9ACTN